MVTSHVIFLILYIWLIKFIKRQIHKKKIKHITKININNICFCWKGLYNHSTPKKLYKRLLQEKGSNRVWVGCQNIIHMENNDGDPRNRRSILLKQIFIASFLNLVVTYFILKVVSQFTILVERLPLLSKLPLTLIPLETHINNYSEICLLHTWVIRVRILLINKYYRPS